MSVELPNIHPSDYSEPQQLTLEQAMRLAEQHQAAGNAATQLTRTVRVAAANATNGGATDQVTLAGTTDTVDIISTGQAVFTVTTTATTATTGTPPANVTFPFGILDYFTSVTHAGDSQTVRLSFSAPLPANLAIYKVDGANNYTLLPTSIWTKIDANTVDITLTDGDAMTDLDGAADGVIHDPIGVGSSTPASASSGGCAITQTASFDPLMILMILFSMAYVSRRRFIIGKI